jgi:dolichol-phosphate mannosyltransferase
LYRVARRVTEPRAEVSVQRRFGRRPRVGHPPVTDLRYNGVVSNGHVRIEWDMTSELTPDPTLDRSAAPTSACVPSVTVIVPTRNEVESVDELIERIRRAMAATGAAYEVLFVDDSDDATPEAVAVHERAGAPVRLVHRCPGERSGGLGGARCAGFAAARGAYVVCLDGDLQHPPEHLAAMARVLLDRRADVVVATRYVPGGGTDGLDGSWRRVVSAASRDLTRAVLPRLRATTDPGSRFFGFDRAIIDGVELRPRGFTTLVEVLARTRWERLAEVPYHFEARGYGRSNASAREGVRYLRHLVGLASDRTAPRTKVPTRGGRTLRAITLDPLRADGPTALVVCPSGRSQVRPEARIVRRTA